MLPSGRGRRLSAKSAAIVDGRTQRFPLAAFEAASARTSLRSPSIRSPAVRSLATPELHDTAGGRSVDLPYEAAPDLKLDEIHIGRPRVMVRR
jgi:hypothetical protein